jgi:hypothetical protein
MRRALLSGLSALLISASASSVVTGEVDGLPVCLEEHPSRTLIAYDEGSYHILLLDADASGSLGDLHDRIIVLFSTEAGVSIKHEYYDDGVLETRLVEHDGDLYAREEFFGPYYRSGKAIFERQIDREAYEAAQERYRLENERFARFFGALHGARPEWLATCDFFGIFPRPIHSNRDR